MTGAPPPRKILMTADAVGGVWTYAVDISAAFAAQGIETVLAVMGPAPRAAQIDQIRGRRVIDTGLALDWMADSPGEVRAAAKRLAEISRSVGADVVHLNAPAMAVGGDFGAPVVGVCHSCVGTWWAAVRGGPMPEDFRWRAELQAEGMARCDLLIAPSDAFAKATRDAYGLRPITVLNGRASTARPSKGGDGAIFTAGRLWDEGKNLAALDKAAGLADLAIDAAGPTRGPQGQAFEPRHLRAVGSLSSSAVRERMSRRPVFVSTALYEPFGLAVLEAAQAGCPLVLSDIATFRELWSDAAMLVDPRDPAAIGRALVGLSRDLDARARLGDAARTRSRAYSAQAMAERTMGAYRRVCRTPAAREAVA